MTKIYGGPWVTWCVGDCRKSVHTGECTTGVWKLSHEENLHDVLVTLIADGLIIQGVDHDDS